MDIYFNISIEEVLEMFRSFDFEIKHAKNHFSAMLKKPKGRYHALIKEFENIVYCDFHWDNKKHYLFIGVDHKIRPRIFFEMHIRKELKKHNIQFYLKMVNWFTRRNKSIMHGLTFSIFTWKRFFGLVTILFLTRFLAN